MPHHIFFAINQSLKFIRGGFFLLLLQNLPQQNNNKGELMTDKKISVYFNMLDTNGYVFNGLHTYVANITPAQLTQISKRLEYMPAPMKKFGLQKITSNIHGNTLEINRTFDTETLDDEEHIMMHCTGQWCNCPEYIHKTCIKNLASGKCKNQYMRQTVGEILFPDVYKHQKQR